MNGNEQGTALLYIPSRATPVSQKSVSMSEIKALRQEILDQVAKFYTLAHADRPFTPGETKIHFAGRVYDAHEMVNMVDAVLDFWLTLGRFADEFTARLAEFLGIEHVLPVNSGSSANLVAAETLLSQEMGTRRLHPGDQVIVPAVSFPTTISPLVRGGLIPVFVDCDLGTYNLNLDAVEAAITDRTRAVLFAHTLGNPVNMSRLTKIARRHDLFVVEDICDALGSRWDGQLVGTFGDLATLSFYPAHHITMGEGGAVVTNSAKMAKIARSIRDWGRACWCTHKDTGPNGACGHRFDYKVSGIPGTYDHKYLYSNIGYNLKPTDIQTSMGVAQLEKLPDFIAARKRNFQQLYEGLKLYEAHLILPSWDPRADVSWFAFPMTVRDEAPFSRRELLEWLEAARIETRLLFAGNITRQPAYCNMPHRVVGELINADLVMRGTFFVGVYPGLDDRRIDYILQTFAEFFGRF
jgi:CDP-6-deoxy-D-xylo-4-hexulose-3-dehydrase